LVCSIPNGAHMYCVPLLHGCKHYSNITTTLSWPITSVIGAIIKQYPPMQEQEMYTRDRTA
jgi:hypothetical protein